MNRNLLLLLAAATVPVSAQVNISAGPDKVAVEIDGKPFTTLFLPVEGNKPYLYPLSTATGVVVTRHYPMEDVAGETHDHPHHRGLFFAHGDISGYNFWATEKSQKARNTASMRTKNVRVEGGPKSGRITAVFEGLSPEGKPVMTETRTYTFYSGPNLRTIDFDVRIDAIEKLTFNDTKEGTFGIRLATSMSEDKGGRMRNAEGKEGEKNVWGKRSPWVDYAGQVNGKLVGVAIMDHPSNPRHPTYWHSRAYGLFAANPFGLKEFTGDKTQDGSLTVEPGKSVRFRYRVVIHEGNAEQASIAALWQKYSATGGSAQ